MDLVGKMLLLRAIVDQGSLSAAAREWHLNHSTVSRHLKTLEAKFEQSVLDQETAQVGRFQGTFYLSRPGRFRWDYFEPYEKLIVADGATVWLLDTDMEQVMRQSQGSALEGTPAELLSGDGKVDDRFEVIDIGHRQNMDWVELLPRDAESQFTRILLAFAGPELRRMEMADKFGQITRFQFYDIQRNPELDEELFKFEVPAEYDILQQL